MAQVPNLREGLMYPGRGTCSRQRIRYFRVESRSSRITNLNPLRSQGCYEDRLTASTNWSSVSREAMKISLLSRGSWSGFLVQTNESNGLDHGNEPKKRALIDYISTAQRHECFEGNHL